MPPPDKLLDLDPDSLSGFCIEMARRTFSGHDASGLTVVLDEFHDRDGPLCSEGWSAMDTNRMIPVGLVILNKIFLLHKTYLRCFRTIFICTDHRLNKIVSAWCQSNVLEAACRILEDSGIPMKSLWLRDCDRETTLLLVDLLNSSLSLCCLRVDLLSVDEENAGKLAAAVAMSGILDVCRFDLLSGGTGQSMFLTEVANRLIVSSDLKQDPGQSTPLTGEHRAETALQGQKNQVEASEPSLPSRSGYGKIPLQKLYLSWDFGEAVDLQFLPKPGSAQAVLSMRTGLGDIAARYLHDIGEVISYEPLPFVIVKPQWFCCRVAGQLIPAAFLESGVRNGIASLTLLESILRSSLSEKCRVHVQDLVKLLVRMELGYEINNGHDAMIPACLRDRRNDGDIRWELPRPEGYCCFGFRIECMDKKRTLLSTGFFHRLQVRLHEKLKDQGEYNIERDLSHIIVNGLGIEVFVEFSNPPDDWIDALVRCEDCTSDASKVWVEQHILQVVTRLCAKPIGLPGVQLVIQIVRPQCVEQLVPCKCRLNSQVVDEAKILDGINQWGIESNYCWPKLDPSQNCRGLPRSESYGLELLRPSTLRDSVIQEGQQLIQVHNDFELGRIGSDSWASGAQHAEAHCSAHGHLCCDDEVVVEGLTGPFQRMLEIILARVDRVHTDVRRIGHDMNDLKGAMKELMRVQKEIFPSISRKLTDLSCLVMKKHKHRLPHLLYFTEKDGVKAKLATWFGHPLGVRPLQLHLMCESRSQVHFVDGQPGKKVWIQEEEKPGVWVLLRATLLVMTALLIAGCGTMAGVHCVAPDLTSLSGDCSPLIAARVAGSVAVGACMADKEIKDLKESLIKDFEEHWKKGKRMFEDGPEDDINRAEAFAWLERTLVGGNVDIREKFQLSRVSYKDTSSIAWICDDCLVREHGAGQVEVVVKDEAEASPSAPPPPPLTPSQRRKREIQEKLREQQALLAEAERQEAAELEAATDASRKEHLLQQAHKTFADAKVAQCTRNLVELVLLQDKLTANHFTNWDERIQRLETRVADLGTQQSKILDAIQNLTAQLTAANVISPLVPCLKPKKPSQSPSPPPSPPPKSPHSSHRSSPSVSSQAKATPPTFATVVAGDHRGPKIPAPSKFKGDDPKIDVGDWTAGTRAYLKGFQCPEQQKVATVVGLLEGPAQKWGTSTTSAQSQTLEDWALALGADKLLQALEDRFADEERVCKVVDKIVRLVQQRYSGSLQALFAEFEQLTSTRGLVMSADDLLTNFCRAVPEKFCVALYSAGHEDRRSFGRAVVDMEAKIHVQAPSSDRRRGAFPCGGRKGKAAFAYAGSGSASETGSQPGTPPAGTVSAAVPDVAAVVQQLQDALGAFQKAGSTSSTASNSKGKSQGRRSSTPAQRPNLPRDVHFPADPLNPNTLPWHDLKIQEGVWRKRKEKGVCLSPKAASGMKVVQLQQPLQVRIGDSTVLTIREKVRGIPVTFDGAGEVRHSLNFYIFPDLPFDLVFSMQWLRAVNPRIDWQIPKVELPNSKGVYQPCMIAADHHPKTSCFCLRAREFYALSRQYDHERLFIALVKQTDAPSTPCPPEIQQVVDQYADLMQEPFGLPNRPTKHHIELLPGAVPPKGRIYRMSPAELEELRRQLETLTSKGWIRPNTSEFGAPVLFVRKGSGEFRMCIDYRGLNKITRKSTEPLPRIDDLLDMVQGCTIFSKVDLKSGYHQIEMAEEDVHKTAFKTRYGTYEYLVMPFGLCNAPRTFQTEMHRIFRPYLDKFMVVYLDDILVFSKTTREHAEHLALVLQSLRDSQYKINKEKSSFGVPSVIYLDLLYTYSRGEKRLCIPEDQQMRTLLMSECHDARGHFGFLKSYAALSQRFFWKEMRSDMLRYVDTYELFQRNKVQRKPPLGLLKPLPIPDGPAQSVSIDFTDLGKTTPRGMRQLMVCVDRFSKYAEVIPFQEVARVPAVRAAFSQRWVTHHGPPTSIVSDRDPRFCSDECQSYCKDYLRSRLDMTSGRHPEANGLAEVMNQVLFQLLRPVISPDQQDWDLHLARAQLMYNMSVHSSTGFSPYRLHWGREPRQPLDDIIDKAKPDLTPGTTEFTRRYRLDVERVRANLFKAQKAMIEQASRHRRPSPIRTGDYVWVASSELSREEDISPKLLPRYLGPWQVLDTVGADPFGPSYVIDVPLHLQTYPVFHASKLLPFTPADAFPDRPPQWGPPIPGKGYDVVAIEDEWGTGPDRQYLVRFAFQPPSENRWFYRRDLIKTAKSVVLRYEAAQKGDLCHSPRLHP
ncbi:hypothetical protein CBR_g12867 [Chara braunii]|uniref:Reverse transcriptase n=1 Tax=Chara braunii TaxID=69332 RepID=A0A388KSY2_CHABU|nr:hypothetical protein CBR_g12867 [Chara braunii]|eukprot:GBG73149.1 hypothetical protein CBR_g12867 [Chara braunii]